MSRHHSPDSTSFYSKFISQNADIAVFEQLSLQQLMEGGFRRVDNIKQPPSEQYRAILEEMGQFMKITTLTSNEVPALPSGWSLHIGNSLATSAHTGKAVTHQELSAIHTQLSHVVGLDRSDRYANCDYVAYQGEVAEKLFPLHILTWIVVEHDGHYFPFDSLKTSKTNADLGLVFRTVYLYQQYTKELLSQLFNTYVAPKMLQILTDIWVHQPGLLYREPTLAELHLNAEELISYMTYGSNQRNKLKLARGPRSNPTEHWHTLIPQFRRRIIRLVTNRDDTTALSEDEKSRYVQILDKLNVLSPLFGELKIRERSSLSLGEQIKMIDESGQVQSSLFLPEVSPIHSRVSDLLASSFPNGRISIETSDVSTTAEEIQAKHMYVLKITATCIESWRIVTTLLPLFSEFDSIKKRIVNLYFKYVVTNSADSVEKLRKYLDEKGLSELTDWLLTRPPTKPMVDKFGSVYQKRKQSLREARLSLASIIRRDYFGENSTIEKMDQNNSQFVLLVNQIVDKYYNSFPELSATDLEKICKNILKAEMYVKKHGQKSRLSQIHQLMEYSLQGLSDIEINTNFLWPLGLVISTQDYTTEKGEDESIVKITISGNDAAGLEKIWGIVARRGVN